MEINCHVPVAVHVVGEPTPDRLDALGHALARAVAVRIAKVERLLADRHPPGSHAEPEAWPWPGADTAGSGAARFSGHAAPAGPDPRGSDRLPDLGAPSGIAGIPLHSATTPVAAPAPRPTAAPAVLGAAGSTGSPAGARGPTGAAGAARAGTPAPPRPAGSANPPARPPDAKGPVPPAAGPGAGPPRARTAAAVPFEVRVLVEAILFLKIGSDRDLALLKQVVDQYGSTTGYAAFLDGLRRAGLDRFFDRVRPVPGMPRPAPSAHLSADTIRMLFGPVPEEPDYWRTLSFEERRRPITVGDRTRAVLRDRTVVIPGPGDQADKRFSVPDNRWEMTREALHAWLTQMVGGRLTPFEEYLVANWNELEPVPQFDGAQVIAYYLVSGSSGLREHRIHGPDGDAVSLWYSEEGLVNEGLGPIEYLLLAHAALKLGGVLLRAVSRIAVTAGSEAAQRVVLKLALTTRRLGRPLSAVMEGVDSGLGVPGIGAGRPGVALVARESSAGVLEAPGGFGSPTVPRTPPPAPPAAAETRLPSATRSAARAPATGASASATAGRAAVSRTGAAAQAGRAAARVVGVTVVDQSGARIGGATVPGAGRTDAEPTDDAGFSAGTFDESPSTVAITPGQGVVTTSPETATGLTQTQVTALGRLLAKRFTDSAIDVLARLWDAAARTGDTAVLTAGNSRALFDLHRNRFWRRVAADPVARALFTDAGCVFAGGAPYLMLNGQRVVITIDHVVERQTDPGLALTASNLRLAFSRENSVVLRLLHLLSPFL
ncbi:hypothetical protein [Actinomadura sp. NTSP31]|uniref:hypothetical protein n=1 Tax=Actinomadura sp. NTSP31 TaxID=1735447 RepID=UPI0035BEC111